MRAWEQDERVHLGLLSSEERQEAVVAKRLMVLTVMLAAMILAAVPAFAQQGEQVTATGLLELAGQQGDVFYYRIVDEEPTGEAYVLKSETGDLGSYLDQRVTVYGTVESAAGNAPGLGPASPLVNVTRVEPAVGPPPGGPPTGPPPGLPTATLSFELAVECEPPADAFFEGLILAEGLGHVPLTDPDGDGLYTGSATLPKFPPGPLPVPPDIEPVSLPLQIVQGPSTGATALGPEYRVIEDFGSVKLDEDKTLAASVSFCSDGGSGSSGSGSKARELPKTGGSALAMLGASALVLVGGLLVRRVNC